MGSIKSRSDYKICGAAPGSVPFNDEHVVPDWILRRFRLHDKRITLPGGSDLAYGQYKVPCCQTCNSRLGEVMEKPVAALFAAGYDAVVQHMKTEGPLLIFAWLNLIFLKTHLKDRNLLINRDRRVASGPIADLYDWPELHHIHCVARTFHTGAALDPNAVGDFPVPGEDRLAARGFRLCGLLPRASFDGPAGGHRRLFRSVGTFCSHRRNTH